MYVYRYDDNAIIADANGPATMKAMLASQDLQYKIDNIGENADLHTEI